MDDEKAVGMTTDAKPLPLSAEELAKMLEKAEPAVWGPWSMQDILRLLATIAQRDEQNESQAARIEALERENKAIQEHAEDMEQENIENEALTEEIIALRRDLDAALSTPPDGLVEALQAVSDWFKRDENSGDELMWTDGYRDLCETVRAALTAHRGDKTQES